ncbi:MAG: hypothetical protein HFI56_08075 [Lachnospiraceae bacterium]|nr:hypothetical protein [Lachnospiraceae bacterium]
MSSVLIKEIGRVITGNTPSKSNRAFYASDDIGFIKPDMIGEDKITYIKSSREFISEQARSRARIAGNKAVCVTCIGIIGKIGIIDGGEYAFNQQINVIEPNEKVSSEYLAYCLLYNRNRLAHMANAPVVPIINKTQFENFQITIEDGREEQNKIVERLSKTVHALNMCKQQMTQYELLIKARFVELFGDPIKNPMNFPVFRMDEVVMFQGGSQPDKKYFEYEPAEENIRLIQIRDYKSDKFVTYIPKNRAKRFCTKDDIMIGRYGPPIFQILKGIEGAYNVALMKAVPKQGNKEFIREFLKQECLLHYLESMSSRTAGQDGIQMDKLKAYPFPMPPIKLQNEFAEFVAKVEELKDTTQKSINELQLLFDSLMQKYFG